MHGWMRCVEPEAAAGDGEPSAESAAPDAGGKVLLKDHEYGTSHESFYCPEMSIVAAQVEKWYRGYLNKHSQ
jgi:hypothetical protein